MVYEGATTDDLKEHGTPVTAIIVESKERGTPLVATVENKDKLIDVFLEDEEDHKRFQIAKGVDFVDIEGITKDNDIYHLMMVGEGKLYIADNILYLETIEERFKTLTILIPIY